MIIIISVNRFLVWAFDNQWADNHDFQDFFEKDMFWYTVLSMLPLPERKKIFTVERKK